MAKLNYMILLLLLASFMFIGITPAQTITISNSSLSTLNATAITPNTTYQYLNTTFSLNVSGNATLTKVSWLLNGTLLNFTNIAGNVSNTTLNYTFAYNFSGIYNLTAIINDSLGNSVNSTNSINFTQYILPTVSTITPSNSTVNVSQVWGAVATQGSFPLTNITWEMDNTYLTNLAFNGDNYQTFAFNQSGYYNTIVQVCDVNGFCSQSTTNLYIASTTPLSYWSVENASLIIHLNPPNQEMMTLTWIPYNDTNSIGQVSINWGDGSPIQIFQFTSGTTQYSFQHQYTIIGDYNITATTCDTIGNCFTQNIAEVYYQQNVVGGISQLLLNTNPSVNTSSIFNSLSSAIGLSLGTAFGDLLFGVLIILGAIILIIIIGLFLYRFVINK